MDCRLTARQGRLLILVLDRRHDTFLFVRRCSIGPAAQLLIPNPVKTSTVTVYDTMLTYNVTAGVGPFNASYVQPYFDQQRALAPGYPFQVLPYSSYAMVNNLVVNPTYSTISAPVSCSGACDSYLLSGGLLMATPWVPSGYGTFPDVKIDHVASIQLDFERDLGAAPAFSDADCSTYASGGVAIAVRVCIKAKAPDSPSILAGKQVAVSPAGCLH